MAIYTIKVIGACTGGEHIALDIKRDGAVVKRISITKSDLESSPNWEEVIVALMREKIKSSGATTLAQMKAAVEAASWVL